MSRFARGFKAQAERVSLAAREQIEVGPYAPLDPERLALAHGVPVQRLTAWLDDGRLSAGAAAALLGQEDVSAVTVHAGSGRLILLNDTLAPSRQRSSLAHEMAHVLLEHPVAPAPTARSGRAWDSRREGEADWLAGALLIPKSAAIGCAVAAMSDRAVARRYRTSERLARWRMDVTGARVIARRRGVPACA